MASVTQRDAERYRFGPYVLEVNERELRREDEPVPLSGKAFDLLVTLVREAGRTITKAELMATLWPDARVEQNSLTQAVFVLRKALGEDTEEGGCIRTVPRLGYKLTIPVERDVAASESHNGATAHVMPGGWKRWAIPAAIAILAGLIAGPLIWSRMRITPMTGQDVLVLADFTNSTGDSAFDGVLREVLANQLEQSPFLKVLDDGVMREDLKLMRRSPQEHITNDLARSICIREHDKAMLGGSIAALGRSYAIELKTANCQTGTTLAREQAEAADKEHVLQALAKAAQGIRAKLGESLSSIQKLAPPLKDWDVTTSSLEAFQAFHQGAALYVSGHASEAIPVLRRATDLDPNLAFAWSFLASAYSDAGNGEKSHEYNERAWALRDRVSAYERMQLIQGQEGQTIGQQIQNAEEFARAYPRNPGPQTRLGRIHQNMGNFEEALANFQEVWRLYRQSYAPGAIEVIGLIMTYGQLDRFDEAKRVAEDLAAMGYDSALLHRQLLWIAYAQDDQTSAARHIAWIRGKQEEYLTVAQQAAEARVRGQLRKSAELFRRAAELARLRNLPDTATMYLKQDPAGDALVGNCATAREASDPVDPSIDRVHNAALVPADHIGGAELALCPTAPLLEKAEELNQRWANIPNRSFAQVPVIRAAIALGLGHADKAIELLQPVAQFERAYPMSNYIRGLAYLRLKKGMDAAAEFQKILDHRGANWGRCILFPMLAWRVARRCRATRPALAWHMRTSLRCGETPTPKCPS